MAERERQGHTEDLRGRVAKLVGLVSYQDGSVVSRQIINRKAGSVTLFAFDQGEGLSEHTTPFDALVQLLDGEAEIVVAGKPVTVKKGEAIIMPANEPHEVRAVSRFRMLLTMIRS
jgi:quercetin dioxygenase-like cupin family protein